VGDGAEWMATGAQAASRQTGGQSVPVWPAGWTGEPAVGDGCAAGGAADAPLREGTAFVQRLAVAELAEGIAHDLKNQLTVVAASVQLARGVAERGQDDLLARAWRAAMRAAQLMDEMLRYTHGGAEPGVDADAAEVLETAVAGAWGYCGALGVQLEMRLAADLPRVAGSAPALRVVLLHALRWIADRCPAGGRLIAEARAADPGVNVRLRVLDAAGNGFAPGSRADNGASTAAGGAMEWAMLQALARQAGARLADAGDCPALLLRAGDRDGGANAAGARGRNEGRGGEG